MPFLASPLSTEHPLPAVLTLIGNTPLVEITRLDTGICRLFVKLENQNPTGSIKDRVALAMIEAAERDGRLGPGGTVVEATAGNTGLGVLGQAGSWSVEGIGEDFIPEIADLSRVRAAYSITDEESFSTARDLLRQEGILGGSSTGTLLAAALRYCREQTRPKRVVTFICDSGNKYLSKMYNDF